MSRLRFKLLLPVLPEDPSMQQEIANGRLVVAVGEGEKFAIDTAKDVTELVDDRLVGQQGDVVACSFVWVDDAGNESVTPATLNVTLTDTIPPADPGALGLAVTEEIADAGPTV